MSAIRLHGLILLVLGLTLSRCVAAQVTKGELFLPAVQPWDLDSNRAVQTKGNYRNYPKGLFPEVQYSVSFRRGSSSPIPASQFIWIMKGVDVCVLGTRDLDSVSTHALPSLSYRGNRDTRLYLRGRGPVGSVQIQMGDCFALRTDQGNYFKVKVVGVSDWIRWRHSGSRSAKDKKKFFVRLAWEGLIMNQNTSTQRPRGAGTATITGNWDIETASHPPELGSDFRLSVYDEAGTKTINVRPYPNVRLAALNEGSADLPLNELAGFSLGETELNMGLDSSLRAFVVKTPDGSLARIRIHDVSLGRPYRTGKRDLYYKNGTTFAVSWESIGSKAKKPFGKAKIESPWDVDTASEPLVITRQPGYPKPDFGLRLDPQQENLIVVAMDYRRVMLLDQQAFDLPIETLPQLEINRSDLLIPIQQPFKAFAIANREGAFARIKINQIEKGVRRTRPGSVYYEGRSFTVDWETYGVNPNASPFK